MEISDNKISWWWRLAAGLAAAPGAVLLFLIVRDQSYLSVQFSTDIVMKTVVMTYTELLLSFSALLGRPPNVLLPIAGLKIMPKKPQVR